MINRLYKNYITNELHDWNKEIRKGHLNQMSISYPLCPSDCPMFNVQSNKLFMLAINSKHIV